MLTRETLPALAAAHGWPVRADHCFMRILLDAVHGCRWTDTVHRRPAYRHISDARLTQAIALAEAVVGGSADLAAMNVRSLRWRGRVTR